MIDHCSLTGGRAAKERSAPATGVLRPAFREKRSPQQHSRTNKLSIIARLRPERPGKAQGESFVFLTSPDPDERFI